MSKIKKILLGLAVLFSTLLFLLSPAGITKVKAAGNKLGAVDWNTIKSGSHDGDYIVSTTTITNVPAIIPLQFCADAPGENGSSGKSAMLILVLAS